MSAEFTRRRPSRCFGRRGVATLSPAPDPARRLVSALLGLADRQGSLVIHRETPWASITFTGARHYMQFVFTGAEAVEAGEHLVAEAPTHEFEIPGQIVADLRVIRVEHRLLPEPKLTVEIEILMLEEC